MSNVKYILRIALMLLLITSVMAAALAAVNQFTEPMIAAYQAEKTQKAIEMVLPGGGEEISFTDASGMVSTVYASETGYAVEVNPVGFDGAITMMVGIDTQGNVLGIRVISHTETAGLGAVAAADSAKGEAFRNQFLGLVNGIVVDGEENSIDSMSGATITSKAVTAGVNAALDFVANLG